jgi:hypothetical protein
MSSSSSLAVQPAVDLGLLYDFSPSIPILCQCLPISAPKPSCVFLHSIYPSEPFPFCPPGLLVIIILVARCYSFWQCVIFLCTSLNFMNQMVVRDIIKSLQLSKFWKCSSYISYWIFKNSGECKYGFKFLIKIISYSAPSWCHILTQ